MKTRLFFLASCAAILTVILGCSQAIWIANPLAGTTISSPQTVTITAQVVLSHSGVATVEFLDGGAVRGADSSVPYEYSWAVDEAEQGIHSWTARVTYQGTSGEPMVLESAAVAVNVELPLPQGDPELVSFLPGLGTVHDVSVSGGEAFIASGEFGLSVLDTFDPQAPATLGSSPTPFEGRISAVDGDRAVVAGVVDGFAHLWVLDVSQPAAPNILGELATSEAQNDFTGFHDLQLSASGSLAIAAMGEAGVWVIDLSNPGQLSVLGSYDTPGKAYGVALDGDLVFVADGTQGLRLLSLANPSSPALVSTVALGAVSRDVAVANGVAYVVSEQGALNTIDVSNPSSPQLWHIAATSGLTRGVDVDGSDLIAFVPVGANGLVDVFDVANPLAPIQTGTIDLMDARGAAVENGMAYVADGSAGLKIFDLSFPVPQLAGSADDPMEPGVIAETAGIALLGGLRVDTPWAHLMILDVADPLAPFVLGELETSVIQAYGTGFQDIALAPSGSLAVAAMGVEGLWVIDLSNPALPSVAGTYDTPGTAYGVELQGDLVFVADGTGDLQIVSIADPANPSLVASESISGTMSRVAVAGGYAYLSRHQGGLRVVDVSNPAAPQLVGAGSTTGPGDAIAVGGGRLAVFVSTASGGSVDVFDLLSPTSPARTASVAMDESSGGVAISGGRLYVADRDSGLKIYGLANPAAPQELAAIPTIGEARDVAAAGGRACLADSLAGIGIVQ